MKLEQRSAYARASSQDKKRIEVVKLLLENPKQAKAPSMSTNLEWMTRTLIVFGHHGLWEVKDTTLSTPGSCGGNAEIKGEPIPV